MKGFGIQHFRISAAATRVQGFGLGCKVVAGPPVTTIDLQYRRLKKYQFLIL